LICAAIDFDKNVCGDQPELFVDLRHAQSNYFCEDEQGRPLKKLKVNVQSRVVVAPDYPNPVSEILQTVEAANGYLNENNCPLQFLLVGSVGELPEVFRGLEIDTSQTLKVYAQYPGTIKFVRGIRYCGPNPSTLTLNRSGEELIKECSVPDYYTTIVATYPPRLAAILLLRGYGHLAGLNADRRNESQYTLADPDMLIPSSPILDGRLDAFKITKYQCVNLVKYARIDSGINDIRR
jgi:hypothetical protein